jgi:hypothetical protein
VVRLSRRSSLLELPQQIPLLLGAHADPTGDLVARA